MEGDHPDAVLMGLDQDGFLQALCDPAERD